MVAGRRAGIFLGAGGQETALVVGGDGAGLGSEAAVGVGGTAMRGGGAALRESGAVVRGGDQDVVRANKIRNQIRNTERNKIRNT